MAARRVLTRETVRELKTTPVFEKRSRDFRMNVLGVGGVGMNLVALMHRVCWDEVRGPNAKTARAICFDADALEWHNFNRIPVPVTPELLRSTKVAAARSAWRNLAKTIYGMSVDSTSEVPDASLTIDCRDTLDVAVQRPEAWVKLSYDGGRFVSFTFNPMKVAPLIINCNSGVDGSYTVTPSFAVPAALLPIMALYFAEFPSLRDVKGETYGTLNLDLDELVNSVSFQWQPEETNAD